jgi:uncharacterized membrane protein
LGINNSGQIVGWYTNRNDSGYYGYLDNGGVFTTINAPSSYSNVPNTNYTVAYGINDSGQIAGTYRNDYGLFSGFLDNGGVFTPINVPFPGSIQSTQAFGINNSGQIAGGFAFTYTSGFVYNGGVYNQFKVPGSINTYAYGINNSGQIIGDYSDNTGYHSFLNNGGVFTTVNVPGSISTRVSGINNSGQIVGNYLTASGTYYGFLDNGGVFTTINVPGSNSTTASGINDSGQIVGSYSDNISSAHGFLATPVTALPPPPTGFLPMPTATPSIANLPSVNHFYSDLPLVLQNHGTEFSQSTHDFLTSTYNTDLADILLPTADKYLKPAAPFLAASLKYVSNWTDFAMAFSDFRSALINNIGKIPMGLYVYDMAFPVLDQAGLITDKLSMLNSRLGLLSSAATAGYNPVAGLIGINSFIYGDLLAPQLEIFGKDPADPDFYTVVLPGSSPITNLPTTGNSQLDLTFTKLLQASFNAYVDLEAANKSFDRYAGAIAAGDAIHATLQIEAILNYLHLYDQAVQDSASWLAYIRTLLSTLGYGDGTYKPQYFRDFQAHLAAEGIPQDVIDDLSSLGLTQAQIDDMKQYLLSMNPDSFSGSFTDLNQQAITTLLQGSSAPVPEPATMLLFGIGIAGLAAVGRRKRN